MAITARTRFRLEHAFVRGSEVQSQISAALASPTTLSDRTRMHIRSQFGDLAAANEFIYALETASTQGLYASAIKGLAQAVGSDAAARDIIANI